MKKTLFIIFFSPFILLSQNHTSIMEEESNYYKGLHYAKQEQWDSLNDIVNGTNATSQQSAQKNSSSTCTLTKKVYGWHPYWNSSTMHNNYDWNLLSELVYFDYSVSPSTGNNTNTSFAWSTSPAITAALSHSVNVHFCASMFSGHSTFFGSSSAQQTFITNAINLLNSRGGKGVNIDFEGMAAGNKTAFKNFMVNLCNQVHAANSSYKVTLALYAVDWGGVFDMPALNTVVDNFIIMGYDYYYSGSPQAGPCAPQYNFASSYNYTLSKSITYYLKQGASKNKLLLGLPWYGREWETVASTIPSNTTGNFTASRTFAYIKNNPTTYSNSNKKWDKNSFTPYYTYVSGGNNRQCFIDDNYSLSRKLDLVNQRGLGGIGIWALGYDNGYLDYWNAIKNKLSTCSVVSCNDSIYDMGGPNRNYYDNESYVYTIAPSTTNKVSLTFSQFDLEAGYDSLYLFDGPSTTSPLLGAYTGASSPGIVTSTGNSITVKFKSDGTTNKGGFSAKWNCVTGTSTGTAIPTTQVVAPSGWITQDFTTTYTDIDNSGGSGLNKSFYQPSYFNGIEWRANGSRGFYNDDFNGASIHPDWTVNSGNWSLSAGLLNQSDETNSNTNIFATLDQTLSNRYLYNFKASINGSGTNRRAGIHIMCDNATLSNRGNSYMIYFRPDQSNVELYEVATNSLTLVKTVSYTFAIGTTYDFKITYDRITGELAVWVNNAFVTSWIDTTPLASGNAISLRSANCIFNVDDLKIFRSRATTNTILVGGSNTNDLRNENVSPSTSSGKISSIVNDNLNNFSTIDAQLVDVDWTKPSIPLWVKDSFGSDKDSTNNGTQLDFNFSASKDTNSSITNYFYAIGTTPGANDVTTWTSNGTSPSGSEAGLSLVNNQKYYVMVKATNGAGLTSDSVITDGILYLSAIGIEEFLNLKNVELYPNPSTNYTSITIISNRAGKLNWTLTDNIGKLIKENDFELKNGFNLFNINLENVSKGIYYLYLKVEGKGITKEIIRE